MRGPVEKLYDEQREELLRAWWRGEMPDVGYRESAKPPARMVCPLCNDPRCPVPRPTRCLWAILDARPRRAALGAGRAVLAIALAGIAALVFAFAAAAIGWS